MYGLVLDAGLVPWDSIGLIGLYLMGLFVVVYGLELLRIPAILSFLGLGLLSVQVLPLPLEPVFPIISEVAVWLLFFFLGLEYSPEALTKMGRQLWKPGLIDFLICFGLPLGLLSLVGWPFREGLLLSAALYPSSTAIVARLLLDTRRLTNPEAELLIGVLIFEDIVGVVLLTALEGNSALEWRPLLKLVGLLAATLVLFVGLYHWILPRFRVFFERVASHPLVAFWILGIVLGAGALGHEIGLSGALLTFLLGVLVPEDSAFFQAVERNLAAIKELVVGLFFFSIPSKFQFEAVSWLLMLGLTGLGLLLKGASTWLGAYVYGLGPRGRVRAALSFLPKGEFSLLFAPLSSHLTTPIVGMVLATSAVGTVGFIQAEAIAKRLTSKQSGALRRGKKLSAKAPPVAAK